MSINESDPWIEQQRHIWNEFNARYRETYQGRVSLEQAQLFERWMTELRAVGPLDIIDVGCGTGWMCQRLARFGVLTGTDLADEVIERARTRMPDATFIAGDLFELDLGRERFDVVVTLEVLSHVLDHDAFVSRLAGLLRPGGVLMIATQNRPVLERSAPPVPVSGQYRNWVDSEQLRRLVEQKFTIRHLSSLTPVYNSGFLHYINSRKVDAFLTAVHLSGLAGTIKRFQEKRFLGWTLVCLAVKRPGREV